MPSDSSPNSRVSLGPDPLSDAFGFGSSGDQWLDRLRQAEQRGPRGEIGSYELLDEIGRGGQGVVYKARQPRTGRVIALKRLSAGTLAQPETRARFEREIEVVSALDHPYVVTVYGSEIIDGQPVLAMQWVDGIPIDRWACPKDLPRREVEQALPVFILVCDAVHHAHQRGVIHRDLKPSNILVDEKNQPHVLDFGLAKLVWEGSISESLTQTGQFLGTPAFAAPEQVRGDPHRVDVRTDIYALGAILYLMLTGQSAAPRGINLAELVEAIEKVEPRPPSSVDRRLNHELDLIVLKAMAKERDRRYPSVDALAGDLRHYLAGEAISAHPPSRAYRVRKFARQHRLGVMVTGVMGLLLAGATVISSIFYLRAEASLRGETQQRQHAELQEAKARSESQKQQAVAQILNEIIAGADRARQQGNPDVKTRDSLDAFVKSLESGERKYPPEVEASVRHSIAETYSSLGLAEQSAAVISKGVGLLRGIAGAEQQLADALGSYGMSLRKKGATVEAEAALREALGMYESMPGDHRVEISGMLEELSHIVFYNEGQREEGMALARRALAIRRERHGDKSGAVATSLSGIALKSSDTPLEAIRLLKEALAIRRALPADESPTETAVVLANLALYQRRLSDFDAAQQSYDEAIAIFRKLYGEDHPSTLTVNNNRALVYFARGDLDGAERITREVLSGRRRAFGDRSVPVASTLTNLGMLLKEKGDLEGAIKCLEESIAISRGLDRHISAGALVAEANLAAALWSAGRMDESEQLYRTILAWYRAKPAANPDTAKTLHMLGKLLGERGKDAEAEPMLGEAISVARKFLPPDHLDIGMYLWDLASFLQDRGRHVEAEPLLREASPIFDKRRPKGDWGAVDSRARLGEVLAAQGRHSEAESHLFRAAEDYLAAPHAIPTRKASVVNRVAGVYDDWHTAEPGKGYDGKAAAWRAKLATLPTSAPSAQPAAELNIRSRP